MLAEPQLLARAEQEKQAGAVGVLRGALVETALPEHGGLLIAQHPGDRHAGQRAAPSDPAEAPHRGPDLRQQLDRHTDLPAEFPVPGAGAQIHQQRTGGVGDVGDVFGSAGHVPDQPGVDRPGEQLPVLGALPRPRHPVQDPGDLRAGRIGVDQQAGPVLPTAKALITGELFAQLGGPGVLPDDGVVDRFPGVPVPDDRGLALIGQPHGRDVVGGEVHVRQRHRHRPTGVVPDLHRIVLHPALLRHHLAVLELCRADHLPLPVDEHAARGRRPLVDGGDVLLLGRIGHGSDCFMPAAPVWARRVRTTAPGHRRRRRDHWWR